MLYYLTYKENRPGQDQVTIAVSVGTIECSEDKAREMAIQEFCYRREKYARDYKEECYELSDPMFVTEERLVIPC